MAKEQIIKSGQITLPRIITLVLAGGLAYLIVTQGDVGLNIGYWGLTFLLAGLLFLVAIDYGVVIDKAEAKQAQGEVQPAADQAVAQSVISDAPRVKRRATRTAKRRR